MENETKMLLCLGGIVLSSQLGWFIDGAELFNGISLIFGFGFGWYASKSKFDEMNYSEVIEMKQH